MKSEMWKSTLREIKQSLGRFVAILAIVALGVSFFSGLKVSKTAMVKTTDKYLQENNFYDYRILSTLGFEQEDVDFLAGQPDVRYAEGSITMDVLCKTEEGNESVVKVHSIPEHVNQIVLKAGRLPESPDECVVDANLYSKERIGQKLTLSDENEEDTLNDFAYKEYTIVGVVQSSLYIQYERGNSSLGAGRVAGFIYIPKDGFDVSYYTDIYVRFNQDYALYSQEYVDYMAAKEDEWESLASKASENRYNRLYEEGQSTLADAKKELADGKKEGEKELSDAREKLSDAKEQLEDGGKQLSDAKEQLSAGKEELSEKEQKLLDGEKILAEKKKELSDGEEKLSESVAKWQESNNQVENAKQQLNNNEQQLKEQQALLEQKEEELAAGEELLAQKEAELSKNEETLSEKEAQLNAQETQLEEKEAQLQATRQTLVEQKQTLLSQKEELEAKEKEVSDQLAQLEAAEAQLEDREAQIDAWENGLTERYGFVPEPFATAIRVAREQIETSKQQLQEYKQQAEDGLAQITAGKAQIEDGLTQIEDGISQIDDGLAQIASGKEQLAAGKEQLASYKQQLADGRTQLDATREEITQGKAAIEAGKAQLADYQSQIDSGRSQLSNADSQLADAWEQITDAQNQLTDGKSQLSDADQTILDGKSQIADAKKQLSEGEQELSEKEQEYEDGKKEYEDGLEEYDKGYAEYQDQIQEAEEKIADGEKQLSELAKPETYVLGRDTNVGYVCFESDSDIVNGVANIFPVFFFAVAALVCITTMNRMVEEQRTQIGVLKALGYSERSIMSKYLFYSGTAAAAGCILGYFAGTFMFPKVIWYSYNMMYRVDDILYVFDLKLALIALSVSLLCSIGTTWISCRYELAEVAAELMRPKAPKAGKRVLLERIPFIWKRLPFLHKVSYRNIFRYKKRFFMMIIGISGCTALLVTGFGLKDSIANIAKDQFEKIQVYDIGITYKNAVTQKEEDTLQKTLGTALAGSMTIMEKNMDLVTDQGVKSLYVIVADDTEDITPYLNIHTEKGEAISYPGKGECVVTNKIAQQYNIKVGDLVKVRDEEMKEMEVKVVAISQNFIYNYLYVSTQTFEEGMGKAPECKMVMLNKAEDGDVHEMSAAIMKLDGVASVNVLQDSKERFSSMMYSLNLIVMVIIFCAGGLAFVVLYNLTNINITERIREIATIKVLGFYKNETSAYIFRENIVLTLLGALVGLVLGKFLHVFVMDKINIDMIAYDVRVEPLSYLYSFLLTIGFAACVNLFMRKKIDRVNMTESLKSVD